MKNVAVVMGGYSDEYKVSLKSGQLIFDSIDRTKYNPYQVHILKEGWYAVVESIKFPMDKGTFSFRYNQQKISFDVIFNIIHGTPGEDGLLQAYWDVLGIPFTGCGHYLSALTFNKKDTLSVLYKYDIPMAKSVIIHQGDVINVDKIIQKLGLPCFVKPNQAGSSLGITKVQRKNDFEEALEIAFIEDDVVLVESYLDGTEVSVGVIQFHGETFVSGITEIVPHNEFFDYEAKYAGASEEITPARITTQMREKVEALAIKVYKSLGLSGMSRSEFIIVDNTPYFLEINTLPGFAPTSILPQQLNHSNITIKDFVSSELENAMNREK